MYILARPPWDSGIPAPELVRAVDGRPPGRALDLGCGTGTNLRYLAELGWQVTGIDFIPRAIARAQKKLGNLPATQLVGDVTRLEHYELGGAFDLALDLGCFYSIDGEGQKRYAAGFAKCIKSGGRFLLYAWQPASAGDSGGVPREKVIETFSASFRLTGYEQGRGRASAWYSFERLAG
jgi:SAM-dependent methyltransferase